MSLFTKLLPDDKNLKSLQRECGLPRAFANDSKAAADSERAAQDNDDITEDEKCAANNVGYATQFSVGTDDDSCYTSWSCLSADTKDSEEMINPRILALIFSAYVAAKTAHTIVSNNALV